MRTRKGHGLIRFVLGLLLWAGVCAADPAPSGLFAGRQPMFAGDTGRGSLFALRKGAAVTTASLFAGARQGGFFAPLPERLDRPLAGIVRGGGVAARLRDMIARAEAGRAGYDAVQHGAQVKPPEPPTQMTMGEIFDWIDATPGQPHAIGRYQFIPTTLRRLAERLGLERKARFTPAVQDRLGDMLLADAGLERVRRGEMMQEAFMLNLAKIWAGLPTSSGRSYYHGLAGNKAVMGYDAYARQVKAALNS